MKADVVEMPTGLKLAPGLTLPIEAVTQTFAILARKGAGKTYAATGMAEQMLGVGAQIIVCDPVGVWYGLRLTADGKADSGLPVYIFGGEFADVPLTKDSAREIARLLATKPISAVLDVSHFRKGERERFMTDFAEEFFHLKKTNRTPVHLFIEEAQVFVAERSIGPDAARMVGAFEDIVRLGRNFGIGATMISQRPQSVNKMVLSQTECLIALQVTGPHERKAIDEWVSEHGVDRKLVGELPSLQQGEAFFWSPGWLRKFERIHIRKKSTYDASSTPVVGARLVRPVQLSPKDLEQIRADIHQSVERAKADDPRELRKRIAELESELRKKPAEPPAPGPQAVKRAMQDAARAVHETYQTIIADMTKYQHFADWFRRDLERLKVAGRFFEDQVESQVISKVQERRIQHNESPPEKRQHDYNHPARSVRKAPATGPGENLPKVERRILTALVQYPAGRTKTQVALLAGYAHSGGGFNNGLSALRTRGYIEGSDPMRITDAGAAALGEFDPLPTGQELLSYWLRQPLLGRAERSVLQVLADAYPKSLTKETVADRAGYEPSGGGFNNALSRLRTLELISGRGELQASEDLFG